MEQEALKPDVVVRIYPPSRTKDPFFTLPLRSQVLCARSSFFAARLSQRWQSAAQLLSTTTSITNNPKDGEADSELFTIDIVTHHSSAASTYKRCIDLMNVQRKDMVSYRPFLGVDDALSMLRIATELLFQDCMDACMEFLDMKCSWTEEEEVSIRSTLSSLQLAHIHPDLVRRLSLHTSMPLNEPTRILRCMLVCTLKNSTPSLKALDSSKPISESSILLAWNTHLDTIRKGVTNPLTAFHHEIPIAHASTSIGVQDMIVALTILDWLFERLLALQAADVVVKALANDMGLSSALPKCFERTRSNSLASTQLVERFSERMCNLLARMLQSVVKGEVLLSQAARLALIKTWLPVCVTYPRLATSLMSLVNSLPVVDREQVYVEYCLQSSKFQKQIISKRQVEQELTSTFYPWCIMLREADTHLGRGRGVVVVNDHAC